jgi:Tol biopolymer transport system component
MVWPSGTIRLLTHETDPKANWEAVRWSPDGRALFAVRAVGEDDSDVYCIDVRSGAAEKLTSHEGKELVSVGDVSPNGKTLLLTRTAKQAT